MENSLKENDLKETKQPNFIYVDKVDVTFQTYLKSLYDCVSYVSEILKDASAFQAKDVREYSILLNMIISQIVQMENFLATYKRIEETV